LVGHELDRAAKLIATEFGKNKVKQFASLGPFLDKFQYISHCNSFVIRKVAGYDRLEASNAETFAGCTKDSLDYLRVICSDGVYNLISLRTRKRDAHPALAAFFVQAPETCSF